MPCLRQFVTTRWVETVNSSVAMLKRGGGAALVAQERSPRVDQPTLETS